jgi:hypothetical protein
VILADQPLVLSRASLDQMTETNPQKQTGMINATNRKSIKIDQLQDLVVHGFRQRPTTLLCASLI